MKTEAQAHSGFLSVLPTYIAILPLLAKQQPAEGMLKSDVSTIHFYR